MTWGRVDDRLHSHPKPIEAKLEAMGLWVLGLSYCCAFLTDGFISLERVKLLAGRRGDELAARLVTSGLWHTTKGGWQFHDWPDWQKTKAQVLGEREAAKHRMQGKRSSGVRSNEERTHTDVPGEERSGSGSGSDPEPYSQTIQLAPNVTVHTSSTLCERIWAELWEGKYKRKFVWSTNTGLKGDIRLLHDIWQRAMEVSEKTEPVFRHWVSSYLRARETWVAEKSHPIMGLGGRVNQYGLPGKPQPVRAKEPDSGPVATPAQMAELAAKVAGIGRR
jgi:hypothetical protein